MQVKPLKTVFQVFYCELWAALIAGIIFLISAPHLAESFLIGEGVMVLGNIILLWRVAAQAKSMRGAELMIGFILGEGGKYLLLVVATILLAKTLPLNWLSYGVGLAIPQLGGVVLFGVQSKIMRQRG